MNADIEFIDADAILDWHSAISKTKRIGAASGNLCIDFDDLTAKYGVEKGVHKTLELIHVAHQRGKAPDPRAFEKLLEEAPDAAHLPEYVPSKTNPPLPRVLVLSHYRTAADKSVLTLQQTRLISRAGGTLYEKPDGYEHASKKGRAELIIGELNHLCAGLDYAETGFVASEQQDWEGPWDRLPKQAEVSFSAPSVNQASEVQTHETFAHVVEEQKAVVAGRHRRF